MTENSKVPRHIAIIMDGNGRWARERGLSRSEGHKEGKRSIYSVIRACKELGVEILTLYAFSTENWKRPKIEVKNIMELFLQMPAKIDEFNENNLKITVMGRIGELSSIVRKGLKVTAEATKKNTGLNVNFAINYGGREEIIDGIKNCIKNGMTDKKIDVKLFNHMLYYNDLPDVDLLIRTAGDLRVSNFMLWHIPGAQMVV
ncbi:di-trans,poly-cis-decaprenylcistransferase, partial [bacterium]|nr:di-trans,poly-cis-decaprenylcistransferase [bacterium]